MSDIAIVVNTAVAILAVVVLIVRFKFNPVVSLVLGSLYLGLATKLGIDKTIETVAGGFGEIMAEVGLLIAFGVLMGAMLQEMGAIQRLVGMLLRLFGPKRMPYALSLTIATALQSIFLDVLLVMSAPLGRDLAKKIGKNGTAKIATAMAIGLECGIVLTVPGVGALALAGLLGVPLGKMLLCGIALVIPTVAIAVTIMLFLFNHGWWNPERDEQPFLGSAAVHGAALGGGFELALMCDMIIAADTASFGMAEASLGLLPLLGGVQRVVQRAGLARGKEMAMFGRRHDPRALERWGVVNLVAAEAELPGVAMSWARQLAAGATVALRGIKTVANLSARGGISAADARQEEVNTSMWNSADQARGLAAFAATGPGSAVFEGN